MARPAGSRFDVPIILGVSTALYAVSLAGVTGLQSAQDQAARDANAGLAWAVADARNHREQLELDLHIASAAYNRHVGAYDDVRARADLLSQEVAALVKAVEAVSGSAARLPSGVALAPPAQRIVRITAAAPAPPVHATTGASG